MTKDVSLLAKEFVDAALQRQTNRGRLAKPNRIAYQQAIRTATVAIRQLSSVEGNPKTLRQSNGKRPSV